MTLHEVIKTLYKFSSEILILANENGILGFLNKEDIIAGLNQNLLLDQVISVYQKSINQLEISRSYRDIPILDVKAKDIDLISKEEILFEKYLDQSLMNVDFKIIFENLVLPMVLFSRFGKLLFINNQMRGIIGIDDENEVIGLTKEVFWGMFEREGKLVKRKNERFKVFSQIIIVFNFKLESCILVRV